MERVNIKIGIFLSIMVVFALCFLILRILSDSIDISSFFKRLPTAFFIYSLLLFIFVRWLWKYPIFKGWLVLIPTIEGTWIGTIESTYNSPDTSKKRNRIKIEMKIIQTLMDLTVRVESKEMTSRSFIAAFDIDHTRGTNRICYSYTSKPTPHYRDKSPIHDGTALLDIQGNPPSAMKGEYWTTRKSTGTINIKLKNLKSEK